MLHFKVAVLGTFLLELLHLSQAFITTIDAQSQDCFFERGPKMST